MLRNCACLVPVLSCSTRFLPSPHFPGPLLTSICLILLVNGQLLFYPTHMQMVSDPKRSKITYSMSFRRFGVRIQLGLPNLAYDECLVLASISVRAKHTTKDGMTILPLARYLLKYFLKWNNLTLHVNQ